MIFETERIVTIYNPANPTPQIIDQTIITGDIKPISVITTTNGNGQVVVVSNNVDEIRKVTVQVDVFIQEVATQFPEINIGEISTIETTQLTGSTEFTIVVENSQGVPEQISGSVIISTGEVIITDTQVMPVE